MAMARWDPFQDMISLREAMNSLFEQSMVRPGNTAGGSWITPMDVFAEDDHYTVEMALPGASADAVDVTVLGNRVTISGEFREPQAGQQARQGDGQRTEQQATRQYLVHELPIGHFERTVTLPTELNADQAQARYENGLLSIRVPKAESARPRRVQIGSGQERQQDVQVQSGQR